MSDSLPPLPNRAVFLSYAHEDAVAVQRLAETLRAANIEVWFDQSELVGGDLWDQKIRAQIKACALFVPVISAATQARREGYFRVEWKLAAQRTRALADGTPFLLPVAIDATRDAEALAPEEFREVQWTRLPGGQATETFVQRVLEFAAKEGRGAVAVVNVAGAATGRKPDTQWDGSLRRSAGSAAARSIAVLPFANLSPNPENEYFSDGITEDLIAQISKIRDLKVISRTSTMRYKGADKALRAIGEELGVANILEGSVRRGGNRVRIVAQLIDAASDEHVWTETYDRELTDVFAIQSEVAIQVAVALQSALSAAELARGRNEPTKSMEAYDLYLVGRHQAGLRSDDGLRRAVEYFERALEKDPRYAAACAGLADAYLLSGIGYRSIPPIGALDKAKEFALKALALDDTLPEAHTALGYVYLFEWDWPRARSELDRAIALSPSYAQAHQWLAHYFIGVRDFAAALVRSERARELDPLSVTITNEAGWPYHYMGLFQRAREYHERALKMDPSFAMAHFNLAFCYTAEGKNEEAIPLFEKAIQLGGRLPFITALLAGAHARSNRHDMAREVLRQLLDSAHSGHRVEPWIAYVHEALGETEQALQWLERAYEARTPFLSYIGTAFLPFERIRDHPRFLALLHKMGLGDAPGGTIGGKYADQ